MTDNITFTCHSDAHDLNISYTWMFNNAYINISSDSFIVNGPQFTVYNVTYSLGGIYECVVTNLIGTGRGYSYLFGMCNIWQKIFVLVMAIMKSYIVTLIM